jgi:hypothetical protein
LSAADAASHAPRLVASAESLRRGVLWALVACGAFGSIEPSPYEFVFLLAALAFAAHGLLFDRSVIPLVATFAAFNVGGLLALVPYVNVPESVTFVAVTLYLSITAIWFAGVVTADPLGRMRTIRSAFVVAAVIASLAGILGYFDIGGLGEEFTLYGRASGTFKDPNVFGPFLVPPMVWLAQDVLFRRGAGLLRTYAPLAIMTIALLLSFSRGAWGVWAASMSIMLALTFLTTPSAPMRQRIVIVAALGAAAVAIMLLIALSIPDVRDVFVERATLDQDYDLGEFGRFGAQLRSIPMLVASPFGFGPLQFRHHFYEADPHNAYINAFASYGWIGGFSYLALIATSMAVGWRLVFQRTPFQREAIAVWSCLFVQIIQGLQIDSDHWRHLYLLFGALFGLAAASRIWLANDAGAPAVYRRASV